MVQLSGSRIDNLPGPRTASSGSNLPVKLEIEDFLEEEHGPLNKRSRSSSPLHNQRNTECIEFPISPSQYNPLNEPSPLGLRLRKSPSLLELIQMRLSQGNYSFMDTASTGKFSNADKTDATGTATSGPTDKLKASNFPGLLLRIGGWEYVSKHEGDLVAKCYFAKHKLVWEVLEGGLKSKIEIQWSDIMSIKADCSESGHGTLTIVLARQPLFFKETNPQPRKHTLWQATADFTDGQASKYRQHVFQSSSGILSKHYEKLVQCDIRLSFLSQQPDIVLDSPYFEAKDSLSENQGESNQPETSRASPISGFQKEESPSQAQDSFELASVSVAKEAPSPSSVMDMCAIEGNQKVEKIDLKGPKNWEQLNVPGLRPSVSVSDLVNHIGNRISEQVNSGNTLFSGNASECQDMLENIAHVLLSDTQLTIASDERSLMKRVNSLCCLLQDPAAVTSDEESCFKGSDNETVVEVNYSCGQHDNKGRNGLVTSEENPKDVTGCWQAPGLSRKDSLGDLLLQLPRIASLPRFLFDISEEGEK